jgi:hypothetical protein
VPLKSPPQDMIRGKKKYVGAYKAALDAFGKDIAFSSL